MLSTSKGLILRVAAVMPVAFHLETPHEIPKEISPKALEAAQDFVDMCCQACCIHGWARRNTRSDPAASNRSENTIIALFKASNLNSFMLC